ncbi:hypothetical protein Cgig2_000249 [Carnegiea gigantea]|uniref:PGG domain-containing protein n=1 Tax=Carnegiea gigantea TaxID=171969 RepID=A0A9Q1JK35_9CARY|nr:hypothetical protein Cgig2_000249 [Carnegiea gigantea]
MTFPPRSSFGLVDSPRTLTSTAAVLTEPSTPSSTMSSAIPESSVPAQSPLSVPVSSAPVAMGDLPPLVSTVACSVVNITLGLPPLGQQYTSQNQLVEHLLREIQRIVDSLAAIGTPLTEQELVEQTITGLDDDYAPCGSNGSAISANEQGGGRGKGNLKGNWMGKGKGKHNGGKGKGGRNNQQQQQNHTTTSGEGAPVGHLAPQCLVSFPYLAQSDPRQALVAVQIGEANDVSWYLNSGASSHMTPNEAFYWATISGAPTSSAASPNPPSTTLIPTGIIIGKFCDAIGVDSRLKITYIQSRRDVTQMRETKSLVAALLVTITFIVGFTLPGGFNSDRGEAILAKKVAVLVFLITNAYIMCYFVFWSMVYASKPEIVEALALWYLSGIYDRSLHCHIAIVVIIMCSLAVLLAQRQILCKMFEVTNSASEKAYRMQMQLPSSWKQWTSYRGIASNNQGQDENTTPFTNQGEHLATTTPANITNVKIRSWQLLMIDQSEHQKAEPLGEQSLSKLDSIV